MKGIVFTEFLEMVEEKFSYEVVDYIIESSELKSKGIYTSVGTYEYDEMLQLVTNLSKKTNSEVPFLLKTFGKYIFSTFHKSYPAFFNRCGDAFTFLESIDKHIHVEVKKLYDDARLPVFQTTRIDDSNFEMIYTSERKMSDFAEGLIEESMSYYKTDFSMNKVMLKPDGSQVKFMITQK